MTINYVLYTPNITKKNETCLIFIDFIQLYLQKATALLNLEFYKIVTLRMSQCHNWRIERIAFNLPSHGLQMLLIYHFCPKKCFSSNKCTFHIVYGNPDFDETQIKIRFRKFQGFFLSNVFFSIVPTKGYGIAQRTVL